MIDRTNITGIVLAGGQSTRMGTDKGLLKINDKTFFEHVADAMKPLVSNIIIIGNNSDYDQFGYERVEDELINAGPLAGLYSGLKHSKTDYNLVLSCDVPMITTAVLEKLVDTDYKQFDVVQIQSQQKTMPLIALYKKDCQHECLELLEQNERRLRVAVSQLKVKTILLVPELNEFVRNVNTKEDLNEINDAIEH